MYQNGLDLETTPGSARFALIAAARTYNASMADSPVYGLQIACDLADLGSAMVEQRFRGEHPGASEDEVVTHVRAWWLDRPGAPDGDAVGRPRDLGTE